MTEQEAQEEAARRMPIYPAGVTDTRNIPRIERERKRFIEGAEWERSRLSSRVVVAAPSDTDRKLIDSLRRKARFFERPEGEGANETELLLNEAADALSRASKPVQVEVTDDMVEQAAQAMWERRPRPTDPAWNALDSGVRKEYRDDARAALFAALGGGE